MTTIKATNTSNIFERLRAACDNLDWDNETKKWKSNDGNWFSQTPSQLATLEQSLDLFIESCKIGMDIQWIIATNTFDLLKNIISNPEPETTITGQVWQLIFNLISGNTENQIKTWKECHEILLSCLQKNSKHKDTCRLIIFNIFAISGIGKNESINILKVLLRNFDDEAQVNESNKQGLNLLLEHFICEEKSISQMYLALTTEEKIRMLKFTNSHIQKGHYNVLPISVDLLICICLQLKSKSDHTLTSSIANNSELQEIMALFQIIATASKEPYYGLETYSFECFELILKVGSVFKAVSTYTEPCEKAYITISNDSDSNLKLLLLSTISNIVQDSPKNKEMARKGGLIENLLVFIAAEGADPLIYKHTIFALIDICHNSIDNHKFVVQHVNNKMHLQPEILKLVLIDLNYKRKN